jgi:dephospho-CoA kinase
VLRVCLTGGLGSGKSTVASMLGELGAEVIEADDLGRSLMEPGREVYLEIVRTFGPDVVASDGRLDRGRLAELAFRGGRLKELNAIVHPAVIDLEQRWMSEVFARDRSAVAVVVSALLFEVERDARERGERETIFADWRRRVDRVIVVTAPDELKIRRYVDRLHLPSSRREEAEADAAARIEHQIPDSIKAARADYVIENRGDMTALRREVQELWRQLEASAGSSNKVVRDGSLE